MVLVEKSPSWMLIKEALIWMPDHLTLRILREFSELELRVLAEQWMRPDPVTEDLEITEEPAIAEAA